MTVIKMTPPKKKEEEYRPTPFDISKEMHIMQQRMIALEDALAELIRYVESSSLAVDAAKYRNILNAR